MQSGYVAFLDVLGFTALLAGPGGDARIEEYNRCLSKVLEVKGTVLPGKAHQFDMTGNRDANVSEPLPDVAVFSDSIVIGSKDDSAEGLLLLVEQCSKLFGEMLNVNIAIRGAIAYGPYTRSRLSFGSFFAGRAIVEAYKFESAQNWVGIMLAPSVVERMPDLTRRCNVEAPGFEPFKAEDHVNLARRISWAACLQQCPRIPFHGCQPWEDNAYDGFAIVPTAATVSPESIATSLAGSLKAIARLKSLAPNPQVQAKYSQTHQWLYQKQSQWANIAYWGKRLIDEGTLKGTP